MTATPTIVARGHAAGEEPPAPTSPQGRGRRKALIVAILGLVVVAVIIGVATQRSTSDIPLAPDNPDPGGARAAAQVLEQQGVDVTFVTTTAAAVSEAEAGSTLLVVNPGRLRPVQQEAIAGVEADIVLANIGGGTFDSLTDAVEVEGYATRTNRVADCADEHAQAAESITAGGAVLTGDVEGCFEAEGGSLYATWTEGDRAWSAISDGWIISNEGLAVAGNAALVFRTLGAHDRLVWYVPASDDTFGIDSEGLLDQFPLPGPVVTMLLLVGVVLVLWRGRRLGPIVVEPLPVEVRASETTRGRGRLYRRAAAHAHAASALRAGFVARVAGRVGLPSHAGPDQVVETLARASGRGPEAISDVLYGAPPTTDEGLSALTQALDTLEREVQRA